MKHTTIKWILAALGLGFLGLLLLPIIIVAAWQERQDRRDSYIADVGELAEHIDYDLLD